MGGDLTVADTMEIPGIGAVKTQHVLVIGGVGLGVAGFAWWRARGNAEEPPAPSPAVISPTDQNTPGTNSNASVDLTDDNAIDTNDKWFRAASEYLESRSYDPSYVATALGKYLDGKLLTEQEADLVRAARGAYGAPPVGDHPIRTALPNPAPPPAPPPPSSPPPVSPPPASPPPAPNYVSVTVVRYTTSNPPWNSTMSGIAAHYGYGGNWGAVWNDPRNDSLRARRGQPNRIQPGDTVWVRLL